MIRRTEHLDRMAWLHRHFPVVAVLGPRQVGKTTLARQYAGRVGGHVRVFDLEFKRTTAPAVTRSMRVAAEALHLERVFVVHAGTHSFDLAHDVRAVAFARLLQDLTPLR